MTSALETTVIFVALLIGIGVVKYIIDMYNQLVSLDKRTEQARQNIDILLKQRNDELSKLIDTAQESMEHEEQVLNELTNAREKVEQAESPQEKADANQQLQQAFMDFTARAEDYPELKSQANMEQVQDRISEIEEQISDRREVYNEAVTQNNTRIKQFPYVLIANQFGFHRKELFEASEEAKED